MKIDSTEVHTVWECATCTRRFVIDLKMWEDIGSPICDHCDEDAYLERTYIPDEYLNN